MTYRVLLGGVGEGRDYAHLVGGIINLDSISLIWLMMK